MPDRARFTASLIQLCASRDFDRNLETASGLIERAAAAGADYVQTPEVTTLMERKREDLFAKTPWASDNPAERHFASLAKTLGIWLHIGSMGVRVSETKLANRAYLFSPDGETAATYDKIHMFDVTLGGAETYRESKNYEAGDRAVASDLPWGRLGIAICYDMRFPALFENFALAGCDIVTAPSAFTVPTGRAHWHTLLRARAIETQCFMLAAAQAGEHECERATYGHSLIVSPWGEVLAEGSETAPEIVTAEIDLSACEAARRRIPALSNRRPFVPLAPAAGRAQEPETEDAA